MNIDDLLQCSAEKLEAMSDAELIAILQPYFNVSRPELAPKPVKTIHSTGRAISPEELEKQQKREKARKIAEQYGLDLDL